MAIVRRKDSKKRVLKEGEYEKSNGLFEFRWSDSRGIKHSVYSKTLETLREKEKNVLKDILTGKKPTDKNLTVNDIYERWEQVKRGLRNNTFTNYQYLYTQFIEDSIGSIKIINLKKSDIRAFYNNLLEDKGLKTSTIDSIHTVLHQVLEFAVDDNFISSNPADNALKELKKAHNKDRKKRKALTLSQQKILENFLKTNETYSHWYPIFTFMLYTGLRVGETTGLRWCDIDFKNNTIDINHTLVYFSKSGIKSIKKSNKNFDTDESSKNVMTFEVNAPKTVSGERTIQMLSQAKNALLEERKYQLAHSISCKSRIDGYSDFIFVNRFGDVQHLGTLNKALRRIVRDCNYEQLDKKEETIPPISCHILRHTFATRMCEAGLNPKAIQQILGHADIQTTMNIYVDATKDLEIAETKTLNDFFKENIK